MQLAVKAVLNAQLGVEVKAALDVQLAVEAVLGAQLGVEAALVTQLAVEAGSARTTIRQEGCKWKSQVEEQADMQGLSKGSRQRAKKRQRLTYRMKRDNDKDLMKTDKGKKQGLN